jgi:type II secretory pathway component PulF
MHRGELRDELERLRADLATGTPLSEAVAARRLPPFYVQMLTIGANSNDLPGILTLIADHYQQSQLLATKLKGLMVYPLIVLFGCLALSAWVSIFFAGMLKNIWADLLNNGPVIESTLLAIWAPFLLISLASLIVVFVVWNPTLRQRLHWRLPAFREGNLARVASTMATLLRGGCSLPETVALVRAMETGSPAGLELAEWERRLAAGTTSFASLANGGRVFSGLFVWLVANGQGDLAQGFQRAAAIFQARAAQRADSLLYTALPMAVVALGLLILWQVWVCFSPLIRVIGMLAS